MNLKEKLFLRLHEATERLKAQGVFKAAEAMQRALEDILYSGTSAKSPEAGWPSPNTDSLSETASNGRFISATYVHFTGNRQYKIYTPSAYQGQALPLVIMLHGCTQNPDDFASGTAMNAIAEKENFFVVYPAQIALANRSKCWNWFITSHQQREQGEPALIAGITREVMERYAIDSKKVYVAGLSAGGAMALVLARVYPDLYAAAGIHSGLPYGLAYDLSSALALMKSASFQAASPNTIVPSLYPGRVPLIIFQGDEDNTVHPGNGELIIKQVLNEEKSIAPVPAVSQEKIPDGYAYTHRIYYDFSGLVKMEYWLVHGAGHAWQGGDKRGSYTDSKGPNATREMIRFFFNHEKIGV